MRKLRLFSLGVIGLLFIGFSGCKDLIYRYNTHLQKKLTRKGYTAHVYKTKTGQIFFYDNQLYNAPVLLFVHGFGGDGKMTWKDQMIHFGKDYRVIVPDLLWFGQSKSSVEASLMAQIKMIKTLIEHLKLHKFHLIGISYGGFVSMGYAQLFPHDLSSLVIVDSPGSCISKEDINQLCNRFGVDSLEDAFVPETVQGVQRLIDLSFYKKPFIPQSIAKQAIGSFVSKHPKKQKYLIQDLLKRRNFFKPKEINVSSLIIWGKNDSIFLSKQAYNLQKKLGAKLIVIPKAGHMSSKDQGNKFNRAVENFLNAVQ